MKSLKRLTNYLKREWVIHKRRNNPILKEEVVGWIQIRMKWMHPFYNQILIECRDFSTIEWITLIVENDKTRAAYWFDYYYQLIQLQLDELMGNSCSGCIYLSSEVTRGIRCAVNPSLVNQGCKEYTNKQWKMST